MPGFNRKGPNGEGPMTGRQMGLCRGKNNPEHLANQDGNDDPAFANTDLYGRRYFLGRERGFRNRSGNGICRGSGNRAGNGMGRRNRPGYKRGN